jgi:multiple sugar transport system permease protein
MAKTESPASSTPLAPVPAPGDAAAEPWLGEKERFMLLLITPAALVLVLFQIVPIVIGANASFRDWQLFNPAKTWVGLTHYAYVLTDPAFLQIVLPNTFLLMVSSVCLSLIFGMALAHYLNRNFAGQWVMQTIILLPQMIAPVIAAMMMRWVFNDQFGVVAAFIGWLGLGSISWLAERWPSFCIIVLTDVWIWTPWFALILLAGLRSLPREPFEAAQIDAAGAWRTFTHITLPMLRSVIAVCVLIRSIDAFRTFDVVWILTGGGPARSTEVFSIYTYIETFVNLDFGRGSAAALVGALIILVVAGLMYKAIGRVATVSR